MKILRPGIYLSEDNGFLVWAAYEEETQVNTFVAVDDDDNIYYAGVRSSSLPWKHTRLVGKVELGTALVTPMEEIL